MRSKLISISSRFVLAFLLVASTMPAFADWRAGKIVFIGFGYDGSTVTVDLSGWDRTDCSCYSPWPTYMCLDRTRTSFKEEYALLLKARMMDQAVNVNIDETTCTIIAMYESG